MSDSGAAPQLVVRVIPDVAGIEAEFDYTVPSEMQPRVGVGSIVRTTLNRRRVRAWVTEINADPPAGVRLLPINKVTGVGPGAEMIALSDWAARHWLGKRSFFLQTASPPRAVSALPPRGPAPASDPSGYEVTLQQWSPATDPWPMVERTLVRGASLLITPSQRSADRLAKRLRDAGHPVALYPDQWAAGAAGGTHVVGTRAAAFAPAPDLAAILVLDAHDQSLQSERSPTWNAIEVVAERARRRRIPLTLMTPVPRQELRALAPVTTGERDEQRRGWAPLHVVDLRHTDPRTGIYSPPLVELLRSDQRVVCVLNRKGRAQLLICSSCDEVARCQRCEGALYNAEEHLACRRCDAVQPVVCANCGSTKFKQLRPGVARVREDLESLALRSVGEVTGEAEGLPDTEVLIGTEAVLHRVGRAHAVAFLDFDQELMATRFRAPEDALVLLARASRVTGGRRHGGVVLVQTRQPDHEVISAALHGDPERLARVENERRAEMAWPPFSAVASISGPDADAMVQTLPESVLVMGPIDGQYLVRAPNRSELLDALVPAYQAAGKTRIEFDPPRA